MMMIATAAIDTETAKRALTNITSTIMYSSSATSTTAATTTALLNYNKYICMDAILYLLISAFTVSITGLFTRWHFPILYIKPKSNIYITGLARHGISTLFVLLAILRYFSHLLPFVHSSN